MLATTFNIPISILTCSQTNPSLLLPLLRIHNIPALTGVSALPALLPIDILPGLDHLETIRLGLDVSFSRTLEEFLELEFGLLRIEHVWVIVLPELLAYVVIAEVGYAY